VSKRAALLLLLALSALTAPTWFYPYYPRYDSGAYLMGIASLADGRLPRVLSHPLAPPATYPPVTMALLAPSYRLSGGSDSALRFTLALCWLAAMALILFAWRNDERRDRLPWLIALAGVGSVWLYVGRIQSEIPYLLVTVAAVICLDRLKRDERRWGGGWGVAALVLVILAGLTRQIGLTLAVGAALHLVWDRRRWRRRWMVAAVFLILGALPGAWLYSVTQPGQFSPEKSSVMRRDGWDPNEGQMSLLSREMLGRVKSNLEATTQLAPGALFVRDFQAERRAPRVALWLLFALIGWGYLLRFRRGPTAAEWYIIPHLGLLWATPWLVETRFFTVLVPWLALYLMEAVEWLAARFSRREGVVRWSARAVVGLLLTVNLVLIVRYDFTDRWSRRDNPEAAMYEWGATRLDRDEVILTRDPFAFYVMTGLQALSYTAAEQKYQPPYRLPAYLAGGGRIDAVLYLDTPAELEKVRRCLDAHHLAMDEPEVRNGAAFARIR